MSDHFAEMLGADEDGPEFHRISLPMPRIFRARITELMQGRMVRPGDPVTLELSGTVKMIDDEGDVMVNVLRVKGGAAKGTSNGDTFLKPGSDGTTESPSPS